MPLPLLSKCSASLSSWTPSASLWLAGAFHPFFCVFCQTCLSGWFLNAGICRRLSSSWSGLSLGSGPTWLILRSRLSSQINFNQGRRQLNEILQTRKLRLFLAFPYYVRSLVLARRRGCRFVASLCCSVCFSKVIFAVAQNRPRSALLMKNRDSLQKFCLLRYCP